MEYKELRELLQRNRSYRRFRQDERLGESMLEGLVELTRYCASGRNLQPLKYRIVCGEKECAQIFPALAWAGYLPEWPGPEEGERPAAYLVQCLDTQLTENLLCDDGLQLEAITLGAVSLGLGTCIIKSFNAAAIKEALHLPASMKPLYVVALGVPEEVVEIEDMQGDDVKYWRDENKIHHVPKRELKELLLK